MFAEESDYSEASDNRSKTRHDHNGAYFSTKLIVNKNLTLADVEVEQLTSSMLRDMRTWLSAKCRDKRCFFGIVDPKVELNSKKRMGEVETLVPFDSISDIAEKAHQFVLESAEDSDEEEKVPPRPHLEMIQRLLNRVVHDHTRSENRRRAVTSARMNNDDKFIISGSSKCKRSLKFVSKRIAEEARYLLKDAKLSLEKVSKRLRLKKDLLRRI